MTATSRPEENPEHQAARRSSGGGGGDEGGGGEKSHQRESRLGPKKIDAASIARENSGGVGRRRIGVSLRLSIAVHHTGNHGRSSARVPNRVQTGGQAPLIHMNKVACPYWGPPRPKRERFQATPSSRVCHSTSMLPVAALFITGRHTGETTAIRSPSRTPQKSEGALLCRWTSAPLLLSTKR